MVCYTFLGIRLLFCVMPTGVWLMFVMGYLWSMFLYLYMVQLSMLDVDNATIVVDDDLAQGPTV